MSTTVLDAVTLARSLRRMAGDGSVEWVHEPIQASVLRDIAELLDENVKLRELLWYNGAVIEACTGEILDHIGVPYIVGPAGVAQALMEATAMLVHKRYDFDPPSFYKEDK